MTMRARHVSTPIWALLIAATTCASASCPTSSTPIGDGACLIITPLTQLDAIPGRPQDQARAKDNHCKLERTGNLPWRLLKVDTETKRKNVAIALFDFLRTQTMTFSNEKFENATEDVLKAFVWLGLRRRGPWNSSQEKSDEKFWYWIADNSTLNLRVKGLDFWGENQPDDLGRYFNASEECAIATVDPDAEDDEMLQFHDKPCDPKEGHDLINPKNLIGIACTADVKVEPESITSKWWFVVICVVAALAPVALVALGFAVIYRKRSRGRRRPKRSRSRSSRSPRSRRSRRSGRKRTKRSPRFDEDDDDGYERVGDEADHSRVSDSFIEMDDAVQTPPKAFKFGWFAKPTPAGVVPPSVSSTKADDDEHEYDNIKYNVRPPNAPPATKTPVKKAVAAVKPKMKTRK